MKKFLALVLCLCFVACGLVFVGCGKEPEIVLNGGPAYEDKIYGNGGMVVTKGDYIYFTESYIKSSSIESSTTIDVNNITETGIYRAKLSTKIEGEGDKAKEVPALENVELMVSKIAGFENAGLYIFKDKLYFATPTTAQDSTGVRYDLVTFYSCNLDGSNLTKFYQTEEFSSGKFSMTMIDQQVYLMVYTGTEVVIVSEDGTANKVASDVTGVLFPTRVNIINNEENPMINETFVYYTVDKEQEGSVETGNILYKANIKTGKVTELLNEERISVSLIQIESNRIFYVKNTVYGSASTYAYYSNTLGENFLNSETKHSNLGTTSTTNLINLGVHNGKNLGFAYINSNKKLVTKNFDGTDGDVLVEDISKILTVRNGYLYYTYSSKFYRISLVDADATKEELSKKSPSLTIKTDYFDIDEDFFYFFAENKEKPNKLSIYRVQLSAKEKTPTLMA